MIVKKYFYTFMFCLVLINVINLAGCTKQVRIKEIDSTAEEWNNPESHYIEIRKHFIIDNAPNDLRELKGLVIDYIEENNITNQIEKEGKSKYITLFFYRRSRRLPWKWQPSEAYFDVDRIEHHKDDCIAIVKWATDSSEKNYTIIEKSSRRKDYGEVIREMIYINDELQPSH